MTEERTTFFGMRTHHVVIALIAVLIAVALVVELLPLVSGYNGA